MPAIEVRVERSRGSVPRGDGTRMVSERAVLGTIGGRHLEWQAIATARGCSPMGKTCHGCSPSHSARRSAMLRRRVAAALRALRRQHAGPLAAAAAAVHAALYGAGHVGRAIALLEGIHRRVQWIDEREEEFPTAPSAAHIERLCVEPVEAEVATAPPTARSTWSDAQPRAGASPKPSCNAATSATWA
ncbi:XdhC family protein [Aquabacterium sp.]|uniref:XdhC family protein n=1 Tax=Aquabacterium sp. TaxID=1872578 RepID=UPI003783DB95